MILGVIAALAAVILLAVIYFNQPYSPLKADFNKTAAGLISRTQPQTEIFSQQDIAHLPAPVQKYFSHCGYIGAPKMSWMKTEFKDVPFSTGLNKPPLKIDYTQYNFVERRTAWHLSTAPCTGYHSRASTTSSRVRAP